MQDSNFQTTKTIRWFHSVGTRLDEKSLSQIECAEVWKDNQEGNRLREKKCHPRKHLAQKFSLAMRTNPLSRRSARVQRLSGPPLLLNGPSTLWKSSCIDYQATQDRPICGVTNTKDAYGPTLEKQKHERPSLEKSLRQIVPKWQFVEDLKAKHVEASKREKTFFLWMKTIQDRFGNKLQPHAIEKTEIQSHETDNVAVEHIHWKIVTFPDVLRILITTGTTCHAKVDESKKDFQNPQSSVFDFPLFSCLVCSIHSV